MMHAAIVVANPLRPIPQIATQVRQLDDVLFALLTKPEPLTAAEWACVESLEQADA